MYQIIILYTLPNVNTDYYSYNNGINQFLSAVLTFDY